MNEEALKWLRQAIEADRAVALAAIGSDEKRAVWRLQEHPSESAIVWDSAGEVVVYDEGWPGEAQAAHIALRDPQDSLTRCEADLAVLGEHYILWRGDTNEAYEEFSVVSPPGSQDCGCVTCHYVGYGGVHAYGICRTVRAVASAYRHRPGYAEHWPAAVAAPGSLPAAEA